MLRTRFVSNCIAEQVDDLKIATLYFDEIEVVEHRMYKVKLDKPAQGSPKPGQTGVVIGTIEFVSDEFRTHASILENEGLLRYVDGDNLLDKRIADEIRPKAAESLSASIDLLWEEADVVYDSAGNKTFASVRFADPEVTRIHEQFVAPFEVGATIDMGFVAEYYGGLLTSLLGSVATGGECVTSSNVLNKLVKAYYESDSMTLRRQQIKRELGSSPSWAYEAIKVNVPDVSKFSFEDVLEMRQELQDELLGFRQDMADIHEELLDRYDPLYIAASAQDFVDRKINPALEDLDRKIRSTRSGVLKKLFDELRDPRAYTPLIATLFDKVPLHIATMASLGFVGISTAWDYVRNMDEIRNNGLYYLIKLRAKAGE